MMYARLAALKDIAKYFRENNIKIVDENKDYWNVTANRVDTKRSRLLNWRLGISKVNYTKKAMSRKK